MLKLRIITALILLPLLIAAILLLPNVYFKAVLGLITLLGAWEWSALVDFKSKRLSQSLALRGLFVIVIAVGLYLGVRVSEQAQDIHTNVLSLMIIGIVYWVWITFAVMRFNAGKSPLGLEFGSLRVFSGIVFFITGFVAILAVRGMYLDGSYWLLLMVVVIMAADSGAYFCGRLWGKTPLAERVSPKKTWAGFWGGLIIAAIMSFVGSYFFNLNWSQALSFCCLSLVAAFFSIMGDLSISVMKRQTGLKDSGSLLPGHGGFLDRMDSIFSGMVIFALGFLWL